MKKSLVLILILLFFQISSFAQNITKESYEKAREILDKSLAAYGGLENLRAIQNVSLKVEGLEFHRNQSRRPDIAESTPRRYDVTLDLQNNRYRLFIEAGSIGGDMVPRYDIYDGKERISANTLNKIKNVRPVQANWREQYTALFLPQFLLVNAYGRTAHLRYLGKTNFNNRPHEVITYQTGDGIQLSLYIDAETYLVSKQESLVSDSLVGDAISETIFPSYRAVGKFKVPVEAIIKIADVATSKLNYTDISFDRNLTDNEFKFQFEFRTPPAATAPSNSPVNKLGDNIYTVATSGYKVLFVDFKDYIWVMEAPVGDAAARDAINRIKETIPNKPIKYVAVTHHHADHSGGVRTFIAEGVTLLTTKGNRNYFEQMTKSRFTIAPDALTLNPQPPKMEFIENGKRVFTDGVTTVELYDIGPSPHAEEMLIAYLPKEKILYEADIFDGLFDSRYPSTAHLIKWIEQKKLAVEKIVPVHGTVTTIDEVQKAVANTQKARN